MSVTIEDIEALRRILTDRDRGNREPECSRGGGKSAWGAEDPRSPADSRGATNAHVARR